MRIILGGMRQTDWNSLAGLLSVSGTADLEHFDPQAAGGFALDEEVLTLSRDAPLLLLLKTGDGDDAPARLARWERLGAWLRETNDVVGIVAVSGPAAVAGAAAFAGHSHEEALEEWRGECQALIDLKGQFPSRLLLVDCAAAMADPGAMSDILETRFAARPSRRESGPMEQGRDQALFALVGQAFTATEPDIAELSERLAAHTELSGRAANAPDAAAIARSIACIGEERSRMRAQLEASFQSERRQKAALRMQLDAYRKEAEFLRGRTARLETELKAAAAKKVPNPLSEKLREQLATAKARSDDLEAQINDMRSSLSWRVTRPIRGASRLASGLTPPKATTITNQVDLVRKSGLLDPEWYVARYKEVAASKLDPAEHYVRIGARKGFAPGPKFSTRAYLQDYPDVAAAGTNPLVHYMERGRLENRMPKPAESEKSSGGGRK